jgi:hypothetical protein
MTKVNTTAAKQINNFAEQKLTIRCGSGRSLEGERTKYRWSKSWAQLRKR